MSLSFVLPRVLLCSLILFNVFIWIILKCSFVNLMKLNLIIACFRGVCSGAIGWDTVLHVGRAWVPFPMGSLNFSLLIPFGRTVALGYQEYLLGVMVAALCRFSGNTGSSTSWNPWGLPRTVWDTFRFSLTLASFGIKVYKTYLLFLLFCRNSYHF